MTAGPIGSRVEQLAQAVAERVVTLVLDAIDLNALIDRIDVERVIEKVDVDKVISQVDIDAVLERVDLDKVIDRVDLQKVIEKLDVNAIIDKVDIDALVEQTEIGSIIAHSTTGVLTEILDVIRAQGVGLDDFILRWGNRLVRRGDRLKDWPDGPPLLVPRVTA